jgi:hypothetical protein
MIPTNGRADEDRFIKIGTPATKWPPSAQEARPAGTSPLILASQQCFNPLQIVFGVDADGVELCGGDVEVHAVFEEAELF